jgi:hypothetical protein
MQHAELYSLSDLAYLAGQPTDRVLPVLEFLTCYGFAERVTRHELLFKKSLNVPAPGRIAAILQTMLAERQGLSPVFVQKRKTVPARLELSGCYGLQTPNHKTRRSDLRFTGGTTFAS